MAGVALGRAGVAGSDDGSRRERSDRIASDAALAADIVVVYETRFTIAACRNVPPILIRTAKAMRLARWDTIRSVLLPAALPDIFSGIRFGFSLTLIGTILGEMFGSQRGLGFLLMTAIGLQNIQVIMSVTLLLVLVAATVNTLLLAQDRRLRNPGNP